MTPRTRLIITTLVFIVFLLLLALWGLAQYGLTPIVPTEPASTSTAAATQTAGNPLRIPLTPKAIFGISNFVKNWHEPSGRAAAVLIYQGAL